MSDIIFYEVFQEESEALKALLPENISAEFNRNTVQESRGGTPQASIVCTRTQSRIPQDWSEGIKGVLTRSQGYDHLDGFRRDVGKNVPCGYLGDYCSRAVGEQAILMMLFLLRKIKPQLIQFEKFDRDGLTGEECLGRNALIVGAGCIGAQIFDMVKGLRLNVKGVDIKKKIGKLQYTSFEQGIPWADIIFCALPLTSGTVGLLDYHMLKNVKKGAVLINVGRGETTPPEGLKQLLDEGILGGLGLDVFDEEDVLALHLREGKEGFSSAKEKILIELKDRANVIFTPHNAFNTQEALKKKTSLTVASCVQFLQKGSFPYPVY